jgi:hypothetical protein
VRARRCNEKRKGQETARRGTGDKGGKSFSGVKEEKKIRNPFQE